MTPPSNRTEIIIDPNADTAIILKDQCADFAVWDAAAEFPRPPLVLPDTIHDGSTADNTEMRDQDCALNDGTNDDDESPESEDQNEKETLFFVSSRHLSLASTYFNKALSEKWDQHERDEKGRIIITEVGWSEGAFARLMYVIHGKTRAVRRKLELVDLAETAHMVDYYDCNEVAEAYSKGWIACLRGHLPKSYGRDLVLWIWIAWVFGYKKLFTEVTLTAVTTSRSEIQSLDLPIPESVIARIETCRQHHINRLVTSIDQYLGDLLDGKRGVSFACASMHLGFFTKALHIRGLRNPPLAHPYLGISCTMLLRHVFEITERSDGEAQSMFWSNGCPETECIEEQFLGMLALEIRDGIRGLQLSSFPSQRSGDGDMWMT